MNRLLDRGIPVGSLDQSGKTALHAAAAASQVEIVTNLIGRGADVNAIDMEGDTPLALAILNHQDKAAQILTARGAKAIRGSDAQRKAFAHARVMEDIRRMHQNAVTGR